MSIFIIIIIFILLAVILYSNLKVNFSFVRQGKDDCLIINLIGLYGTFKYTTKIPFIDLVDGREGVPALEINTKKEMGKKARQMDHSKSIINLHEMERIINKYKKIYIKYETFIKHIKRKLVLNNISWYTEIGTNDAAETAIITGLIWAIKASIIVLISKGYNLSDVYISVVPNYNIDNFETSIDCIFSIKLGYIINAGIKTLLVQIKDGVKNE